MDRVTTAHAARLRHLEAVDEWLTELDREQGPVPSETLAWAANIVADWENCTTEPTRRQAN